MYTDALNITVQTKSLAHTESIVSLLNLHENWVLNQMLEGFFHFRKYIKYKQLNISTWKWAGLSSMWRRQKHCAHFHMGNQLSKTGKYCILHLSLKTHFHYYKDQYVRIHQKWCNS